MSVGHVPLNQSSSWRAVEVCAAGTAPKAKRDRQNKEEEQLHADTLIYVVTSKCVHAEAAGRARWSVVIIWKKWITLRLDCCAQSRAIARHACQVSPPVTLTHIFTLSFCRLLDRYVTQGSQNGDMTTHNRQASIPTKIPTHKEEYLFFNLHSYILDH